MPDPTETATDIPPAASADFGAGLATAALSSSSSPPSPPVAVLTQVSKTYRLDAVEVPVIRNVDLLIRPGHFTVLLGPSGSGKTTLLNMIGCIDRPDAGEVVIAGVRVNELSDDALSDFRAKNIGFIFQNFNLLPVLTAYENVEYPLLLAGSSAKTRARRVPKLLAAVGLSDKAKNLPGQLSGGQRQRVAIARALARKPKLVIADEPTANLDSQTGAAILALMRRMQARYQISFVFSSHDRAVRNAADDTISIKDGSIRGITRKPFEPLAAGEQPAGRGPGLGGQAGAGARPGARFETGTDSDTDTDTDDGFDDDDTGDAFSLPLLPPPRRGAPG